MEIRDYMKIRDDTHGRIMGQVMITWKPPRYLPEIPGELIFRISGNDYLFHYLPEIFGNLICNNFGARSSCVRYSRKKRKHHHRGICLLSVCRLTLR